MNEDDKQKLVDVAIEQMKIDIRGNDWTAIDCLLHHLPENVLEGYLPEEYDYAEMINGEKEDES